MSLQDRTQDWAALLGHWTAVARASAVLPEGDAEGAAWKASIAPMITLQAVVMALGESVYLDLEQRLVACDRAGVLVREQAKRLSAAWGGQAMPDGVLELMEDARASHEAAEHLGYAFVAVEDGVLMPEVGGVLRDAQEEGRLERVRFGLAAPAGTGLGAGMLGLFLGPDDGGVVVAGLERSERVEAPMQVYLVGSGGVDGVEVVPFLGELRAGRPLLRQVIADGELLI